MAEELRISAEEPPSPEAVVADSAVRKLVLVRREFVGQGESQEPGQPEREQPFRRYALATQRALQDRELPFGPGGAAA